jgi:hypothetical protein
MWFSPGGDAPLILALVSTISVVVTDHFEQDFDEI